MPDTPLFPASGALRVFGEADVDRIARQVEPVAFAQRDDLLTRQATYRRWLEEMASDRAAAPTPVSREIADLEAKVSDASPRLAKKYRQRLAALAPQRAAELAGDTPDMARVRRDLMQADQQLRDLGPTIARANKTARVRLDREIELAPVKSEILDRAVRALRRGGIADPHERLWPLVHGDDGAAARFDQAVQRAGTPQARRQVAADLVDQAQRQAPAPPQPQPVRAERPRGDGGPQSSAEARLKTYSDPGAGGQIQQAQQLEIAAREDLERAGEAPDPVPQDALTGEAVDARVLLEDFARDQAAVDYLAGCVPGGGA